MRMSIGFEEGRVLHGLLEEASGDIVVRVDATGFIVHTSENFVELGIDPASLLVMPHIADLAASGYAPVVANYVDQIFAGCAQRGWVEFPVLNCQSQGRPDCECASPTCLQWYAFSLKMIETAEHDSPAALGLLRSVQQRHSMQGEIDMRAVTDPLTGLANRHTFCASLRRCVSQECDHALAIFAVDRLRAIFMQYGQRTTDEIQWGFAKFLESMTLPGQELGQIDDERFGVLLPGMTMKQARQWSADVLATFEGLAVPASSRAPHLMASAGLSRVETSVDWTLRQAELGLVMARAGGGGQVGVPGQRAPGLPLEPMISQIPI